MRSSNRHTPERKQELHISMSLFKIRWLLLRLLFFAALVAAVPCPWYLIAVGGLLPLPVIAAFALRRYPFFVINLLNLLHLAVYPPLFLWLSHVAAVRIHSFRIGYRSLAVAIALSALLLLSFAPIYGSGENILGGGGRFGNLYAAYRDNLYLSNPRGSRIRRSRDY